MKRLVSPMAMQELRRLLNRRPSGDGPWRKLFRRFPELLGNPSFIDFEVDVPGIPHRRADFLTGPGHPGCPGMYLLWEFEGCDSPVFTRRQRTIVPHWTLTLGLQQLEDWKVAIEKYLTAEYFRDRCPGFAFLRYELVIGHTLSEEFHQKLTDKDRFVLGPMGFHVRTYTDFLRYWGWGEDA
jgi:hypothetical protein